MKTFIWFNTVVICSISWISVSEAQSQTVKVQSGQSVTLRSPKLPGDAVIIWSRLIKTTNASCICYKIELKNETQFCEGFKDGNIEMGVNATGVQLTIRKVNLSDSGIYFCEFYSGENNIYHVIYLDVEGKNMAGSEETQDHLDTACQTQCNKTTCVMSLILGGVTVFLLLVVTGLVVSLRKLQTAENEEQKTHQQENPASDDLNYAAVSFRQKERRREVEPNVVYSATR
ncbi:uncharacterized protein LOC114851334 [Betta splendens]|uniref:Uncharacterized protein LOC114851334 n=1 Tax=Betta splendens TaxID=158456 RepID=A0A6P7LYH4_BETSP|nr:uncharacterized protein LOC114851334 [Betta splendens]